MFVQENLPLRETNMVSDSFQTCDIRETPNLHLFKKGAFCTHQSRRKEKMFAEDFKRHYDGERALGHALVARASEKSSIIRKRLAVVAEELRQAAATAGTGSEGLLRLARQFERNSRPGDQT